MNKKILILSLLLSVSNVFAETVWCRNFKIGCATQEEKNKQFQNCLRLAAESRQEGLIQALSDASIWQLAGARSAEDYANMRQKLMMSICLKNSN